MKSLRLALATFGLLGCTFSAQAREAPNQKIVMACSGTHPPIMADIAHAIEVSDYWAPQTARRQMLELAREACARRPAAVLTFVPPVNADTSNVAATSK